MEMQRYCIRVYVDLHRSIYGKVLYRFFRPYKQSYKLSLWGGSYRYHHIKYSMAKRMNITYAYLYTINYILYICKFNYFVTWIKSIIIDFKKWKVFNNLTFLSSRHSVLVRRVKNVILRNISLNQQMYLYETKL